MTDYQAIIIGGGPVGIALGIELGMQSITTAIYEKHAAPQILPKAQLLNPRSMEFFRRWGISQALISKRLLPPDFPLQGIWCAGMAAQVYATVDLSDYINENISPENYQRIPLWITETVLRERLKDFPSVQLFNNCEITSIEQNDSQVNVTLHNKLTAQKQIVTAQYIIGCDGANSITRQCADINVEGEPLTLKILNMVFRSPDLKVKMTVPKGFTYYNLSLSKPGAIGCIDYDNNFWYAQMTYSGNETIDEINTSNLLDQIAGFNFDKEITSVNFWEMRAQLAHSYRRKRILLAGDAAHILPPTGGHGLNTGLGDAVNLAWKLTAVINKQAGDVLLDSYEVERRPVALRNLIASKKNALDAQNIRKIYPPETMPMAFAKENERIAKQHLISPGLALGYCYINSLLIPNIDESHYCEEAQIYQPTAESGYFAPHFILAKNKALYDDLSPHYILLTYEKSNNKLRQAFAKRGITLKICELPQTAIKNIYPNNYYLLRPDWHIAWHGNIIPANPMQLINQLMPQ